MGFTCLRCTAPSWYKSNYFMFIKCDPNAPDSCRHVRVAAFSMRFLNYESLDSNGTSQNVAEVYDEDYGVGHN